MRLAWSNAKLFNREGSDLWAAADRLSSEFESLFCEWVINPPDGFGYVWMCLSRVMIILGSAVVLDLVHFF